MDSHSYVFNVLKYFKNNIRVSLRYFKNNIRVSSKILLAKHYRTLNIKLLEI